MLALLRVKAVRKVLARVLVGVVVIAASTAQAQPAREAELEQLLRTVDFLERNGGLEPRAGLRVGISDRLINRLLSSLTPYAFPLADNLGRVEITSARATFEPGFPRIRLEGRAILVGGALSIKASVDAAGQFTFDNSGQLRMAIEILSITPDRSDIPPIPGAADLVETLAQTGADRATQALTITIPLARTVAIPIPRQTGTVDVSIGKAALTLAIRSEPLAVLLRLIVTDIITLSDGIYLYAKIE